MGRAGSLSALIARGGGPRRSRGNRAEAGPLRKIVSERMSEHGVLLEVYECGHAAPQKRDIIGPTNASRRRCRRCAREAQTGAVGRG